MSDLLTALRQETGVIHNALHEHPILIACQEARLNTQEYIHILKAFYAPWLDLIPAVESVPLPALRTCLATRAKALGNDLDDLNIKVHTPTQRANFTECELLGICYVLVGSSLGATQLRKSIRSALGPVVPISYMSISPKDAGWPLLAGHLRSLEADQYPKACLAAKNVFECIQMELSKPQSCFPAPQLSQEMQWEID